MKRPLILGTGLAFLLCAAPCWAGISRDGYLAGGSSGTFTATNAGSLKIVFALRNNNATPPSLPSGWTTIASGTTANFTGSYRIGCNVSSSSSDTSSGTWTNASVVVGLSYSGTKAGTTANCNTTGTGGGAESDTATTTVTYAGITMSVSSGSSWVAGLEGSPASAHTCTPAGMTLVHSENTHGSLSADTNAGVTGWSTTTCGVAGSFNNATYVIEILAASAGVTAPQNEPLLGCCDSARHVAESDHRRKRA